MLFHVVLTNDHMCSHLAVQQVPGFAWHDEALQAEDYTTGMQAADALDVWGQAGCEQEQEAEALL